MYGSIKNVCLLLSLLLILTTLMKYSIGESIQCFDYQFPQAIGQAANSDASTMFFTLDVSPSGYIIAGGASNETKLVNGIQTPIMVQFNSKGQQTWAKQITTGAYQYVSNLRHMNDDYIVAVLSAWGPIPSKQLTLALFSTTPLTFIKAIVDSNEANFALSGSDSIIFQSASVFNFVYSDHDGYLILTKFNIEGSTMTLIASAKFEVANYNWYSVSLAISSYNLFVSGYAEGLNDFGSLSMFSLGNFEKKFSIKQANWYQKQSVQKIKFFYNTNTGFSYIYGCLGYELSGYVQFDITNIYSITAKQFTTLGNSQCYDIYVESTAKILIFTQGVSYVRLFKINEDEMQSVQVQYPAYVSSGNRLWGAKIINYDTIYYASNVENIKGFITQTFLKSKAFLNRLLTSDTGNMTVPNLEIPVYVIFSDPISVVIPSYMQTECNDAIIKTSIISTLPTYITFDGNYKLTISSNDLSKAGSHILKFRQTIQQNSQYLDGQFTFKLINPCPSEEMLRLQDLQLLLYNSSKDDVETNDNGYISLDQAHNQIKIYSASSNAIGTHTVKLQGSLLAFQLSKTIQFKTIIQPNNNFAPRYSQEILDSITLFAPTRKIIGLPDIIDDDGDSFTVQFTYGKTKPFLSYASGSISIQALASNVGEYDFSITLTDDNPVPLSQTYKIHLSIMLDQASVTTPSTTETNNSTNSSTQNTSLAYIVSTNDKIQSTQVKKVNYQTVEKSLKAYISSISMMGEVDIKFSERILDLKQSNLQNQTALSLKLDSKIQSLKNFIKTWEIISVSNTGIKIQITFNEPLLVSSSSKDDLKVEFLKPQYFIAATLKSALPQKYTIKKSTAALQSFGSSSSNTLVGSVMLNFFLALALGLSLKQLWMLINTLQIICAMPLLQMQIPSNFILFAQSLKDISNLNIIPKQYMSHLIGIFKGSNDDQDDNIDDGKMNKFKLYLTRYLRFFFSILSFELYQKVTQDLLLLYLSKLKMYQKMLTDDQFQSKYGTMYMNLKTTEVAVLYPTIFFARRLLFAVSIGFMDEHPALQLTTQIIISMGFMSFIVSYKPMESHGVMIFEFLNEASLMIVSYILVPITIDDFADDLINPSSKQQNDVKQETINSEFETKKQIKKQTTQKKQIEKENIKKLKKEQNQKEQSRYKQINQTKNQSQDSSKKLVKFKEENLVVMDFDELNMAQTQITVFNNNYDGYDIFRFDEINDEAFKSPFEKSNTIQTKK
ncbi:UNKNOWN [Stylonychia lemnae]|uniref:Cadg domain containing protein n=1 Tax=Stylonychia lemnae TaxID=5949 RepID=A0A077ZP84_STYLE|nr:UNKNOWN [Stylonychia lemnae]|eukprot:CDW71772.1 UNKNOWN [Stylonychia lemnae]